MKGILKADTKDSNLLYRYNLEMNIYGNIEMEAHIIQNLEQVLKKYFLNKDENVNFEIKQVYNYVPQD